MTFIEKKKFHISALILLVAVLALIMIFSSTMGAAKVSFSESIKIIMGRVPLVKYFVNTQGLEPSHHTIILNIRLPRIILAALVGMGLSVVGAGFQGMFRNPMADPYVIGISSGAALGAAIGIVITAGITFWEISLVNICAFAGAILTTFMVYRIARVGSRLPATSLLLAGVAVGFLMSSMVTIIMVFFRKQMEYIVFWLMGSFTAASWKQVIILAPIVLLGSGAITLFSRDLNAMAAGEDAARSLGINVETVKKILFVISSVVVASCVSVSGVIGFVGLIIPHVIRLILGPDHRVVLPFSAVGGAMFLVLADTGARIIVPPAELPVGAITSLFGAPFFIYLLMKNKKRVV